MDATTSVRRALLGATAFVALLTSVACTAEVPDVEPEVAASPFRISGRVIAAKEHRVDSAISSAFERKVVDVESITARVRLEPHDGGDPVEVCATNGSFEMPVSITGTWDVAVAGVSAQGRAVLVGATSVTLSPDAPWSHVYLFVAADSANVDCAAP